MEMVVMMGGYQVCISLHPPLAAKVGQQGGLQLITGRAVQGVGLCTGGDGG